MLYLQLKLHLLVPLQIMKLSAISFSSPSAWGRFLPCSDWPYFGTYSMIWRSPTTSQ